MALNDSPLNDPKYDVGSINVDSVKECLITLAQAFPWVSESDKVDFVNAIQGIDKAGDPRVAEEQATQSAEQARIAELEAELAAAKANAGQGQ